jgi:hypothetical protein
LQRIPYGYTCHSRDWVCRGEPNPSPVPTTVGRWRPARAGEEPAGRGGGDRNTVTARTRYDEDVPRCRRRHASPKGRVGRRRRGAPERERTRGSRRQPAADTQVALPSGCGGRRLAADQSDRHRENGWRGRARARRDCIVLKEGFRCRTSTARRCQPHRFVRPRLLTRQGLARLGEPARRF